MPTKVIVSGYAWVDASDYDLSKIASVKRACTVTPRRTSRYDTDKKLEPIELFQIKENLIGVPREYYMRNRTIEHESEYRVAPGRPWSVKLEQNPDFAPRDDQPEAIEAIMGRMKRPFGGGILQAPTGWGKTVVLLEIARRIGLFTAILVEKDRLKNQWINMVKAQLPGIRVGYLQQDRFDPDVDVMVCMTDSMKNREEVHQPLYENVGLVIADEVHHMGARTSVPLLGRFKGPYRLGASAKPTRIDGCDRAFYDNIGTICFKASVRRMTPRVVIRKTRWEPIAHPNFDPEKIGDQKLISIMVNNVVRNEMIVHDILEAVKKDRIIIVFSHRRDHLDTLRGMFARERPKGKTDGFLRGGMSKKELDRSDTCDVLFATYEFCREAYDNKRINTVALTTPIADPEQPIGRGTRWHPAKIEPIVLDYVDSGPEIFVRRFDRRLNVYRTIKAVIHGRD